MNTPPQPPVNVAVHYTDGEVVPLELVHVGPDEDGCAIWTNVHPIRIEPGMKVRADVIPARTSIVLGLGSED